MYNILYLLTKQVFFQLISHLGKKSSTTWHFKLNIFRYHYIFIYCAFFKDPLITSACTFFISFRIKTVQSQMAMNSI